MSQQLLDIYKEDVNLAAQFFELGANIYIPHDVFSHIMTYIPAYPYFFTYRLVCKNWLRELEDRIYFRVEVLDLLDRFSKEDTFITEEEKEFNATEAQKNKEAEVEPKEEQDVEQEAQVDEEAAHETSNLEPETDVVMNEVVTSTTSTRRVRWKSYEYAGYKNTDESKKAVDEFIVKCFPNIRKVRVQISNVLRIAYLISHFPHLKQLDLFVNRKLISNYYYSLNGNMQQMQFTPPLLEVVNLSFLDYNSIQCLTNIWPMITQAKKVNFVHCLEMDTVANIDNTMRLVQVHLKERLGVFDMFECNSSHPENKLADFIMKMRRVEQIPLEKMEFSFGKLSFLQIARSHSVPLLQIAISAALPHAGFAESREFVRWFAATGETEPLDFLIANLHLYTYARKDLFAFCQSHIASPKRLNELIEYFVVKGNFEQLIPNFSTSISQLVVRNQFEVIDYLYKIKRELFTPTLLLDVTNFSQKRQLFSYWQHVIKLEKYGIDLGASKNGITLGHVFLNDAYANTTEFMRTHLHLFLNPNHSISPLKELACFMGIVSRNTDFYDYRGSRLIRYNSTYMMRNRLMNILPIVQFSLFQFQYSDSNYFLFDLLHYDATNYLQYYLSKFDLTKTNKDGQNALFFVSSTEALHEVLRLKGSLDRYGKDKNGNTPFACALQRRAYKVLDALFDSEKIDISHANAEGKTVIHLLTEAMKKELVKDEDQTDMTLAASVDSEKDAKRLQKYIEYYIKFIKEAKYSNLFFTFDNNGRSPIANIVDCGDTNIMADVINNLEDYDLKNITKEESLLLYLVNHCKDHKHNKFASYCFEYMSYFGMKESQSDKTALHIAIENENNELVSVLLKYGLADDKEEKLDINATFGEDKKSAVVLCCEKGMFESYKLLLKLGCKGVENDFEICANNFHSMPMAFKLTAKPFNRVPKTKTQMVDILIQCIFQKKLNVSNLFFKEMEKWEKTVEPKTENWINSFSTLYTEEELKYNLLHLLVEYEHDEIVSWFLQRYKSDTRLGEVLQMKDSEQFTILHHAVKKIHSLTRERLILLICDLIESHKLANSILHCKDANGLTILFHVDTSYRHCEVIVERLVLLGANYHDKDKNLVEARTRFMINWKQLEEKIAKKDSPTVVQEQVSSRRKRGVKEIAKEQTADATPTKDTKRRRK